MFFRKWTDDDLVMYDMLSHLYIKPNTIEEHDLLRDLEKIFANIGEKTLNREREKIHLKLAKKGDLLFSRYVLNMRRYHGSYSHVSWAKCESRSWLNESFYNECFNKKEKAIILRTRNTSPYGDTTVTTEDYVFFLSAKEFREYVTHNQLLQGEATSLARSNDVYIEKGHCYWWLRGSSRRTNDADRVDLSGGLDLGGNTNAYGVGVRPAIWVKLDALMAELYEVR